MSYLLFETCSTAAAIFFGAGALCGRPMIGFIAAATMLFVGYPLAAMAMMTP